MRIYKVLSVHKCNTHLPPKASIFCLLFFFLNFAPFCNSKSIEDYATIEAYAGKEKVPVSIYLVNGIKLQGTIDSFDQFVVLLRNSVNQMVYKHAISTIVPTRNVRLPAGDDEEE